MPKLIDYPRTSYTGAWELAEIVDDTGGKCAIETAARKLNRKVSGSFKAIIGSGVKFGLMTSKRELLTTTTLFRRIKHAYDKAEELQFHREAFLTPPLFTQLCRKFRNRELPVQMLDVMLIREFGVEEINAQNVAKAFVDGCRMCGLLDERNIIADIDAFSNARAPRRELASPAPIMQTFTSKATSLNQESSHQAIPGEEPTNESPLGLFGQPAETFLSNHTQAAAPTKSNPDAVASLFGFETSNQTAVQNEPEPIRTAHEAATAVHDAKPELPHEALQSATIPRSMSPLPITSNSGYQMQMSGPGVNTVLDITDEDDLAIAIAMLEKIRRQLRATHQ